MPTYEYRCTDCGNRVEVFQRIGDDPLTVCEVCGGPLRKVFHPAGIVFKGSGFYATDSRPARSGSGDGKGSEKAGSGTGKKGSGDGGTGGGGSTKSSGSGSSGSGSSGSGSSGSGSSGSGSSTTKEKTS